MKLENAGTKNHPVGLFPHRGAPGKAMSLFIAFIATDGAVSRSDMRGYNVDYKQINKIAERALTMGAVDLDHTRGVWVESREGDPTGTIQATRAIRALTIHNAVSLEALKDDYGPRLLDGLVAAERLVERQRGRYTWIDPMFFDVKPSGPPRTTSLLVLEALKDKPLKLSALLAALPADKRRSARFLVYDLKSRGEVVQPMWGVVALPGREFEYKDGELTYKGA